LIHNAGATFADREITKDGIEATLAVDVMGPFLLTALLRERLEASHARVIALTGIYQRRGRVDLSDLHFDRRPYGWLAANNQAQRGRLLFVSELARRAPAIMTAAVHPGAVLTRAQACLPAVAKLLVRTVMRPGFVRAEIGAMPVVRLAAVPVLPAVTGRFFNRYSLAADVPDAREAQAFWATCEARLLPSNAGADS
jgi:NAD(P)-dependent dehydrogenase (short-subunit alcohol dehydrogenase family)